MARIIHRKDPAGIEEPIVYDVPENTNVLTWLHETFADYTELCGDLACSFVLNQKVIFSNDDDDADESNLDFTLGKYDDLVIVNRPADPITAVLVVVAVVAVATAVLTYLALKDLPGDAEGASTSPNNLLNAASNEFRPRQGIPECFGYGVSYPDFIQPSYYYYEDNLKIVVGLFCISVGEVDVTEVRVGDTDIDNIPRSSYTIYGPGVTLPNEYLTIHQTSSEVDGQVAVAPDDESVIQLTSTTLSGNGTTTTASMDAEVVDDIGLADGGYIYIRSTVLNGVFEITSITGNSTTQTVTFSSSYNGSTTEEMTIGRGYEDGVIGSGTSGELDTWTGWFDLPDDDIEEVWINWQAPTGVRGADGGTITIKLQMQIESLDDNGDPTGNRWSQTVSISENTFDAQFRTTTFTPSSHPGMTRSGYRWRGKRLTNVIDEDGSASEQIKWELIESVTPYSNPNFGDVTTILVERKATLFSADQSGKKINLDYRRKLPTYNRTTGVYDENTLTATDSFADAAAYTLIAAGKEDANNVDLAELYAIYDGLSDSQLGGFTFTFDDADLSMGERVEAICNVARTVGYHDGSSWRFTREEAKPVRSAMFNRRALQGNNSVQSWSPQRDDDSDSVRIIYVDPDENSEAYVERYFDLNTNTIESGDVGNVVKEINLAGCRNYYQAYNRAELEIRRLAYQRRTVTDITYRDALELELLDRVDWVDINDTDTFDGEIIGIDGDTYDTTERFIPADGESYVVFVTDEEGYPSNTVECLARDDTEFGFIAVGLSGAYVASGDQQISSRYFIANASDLIASEFTLKTRTPGNDGTVEIELIEYRSEMFEADETAAPTESPLVPSGLIASNIEQSGTNSTAILTLNDNGTMTVGGDTVLWYSGGATAGIGDSFEAKVTAVSGSNPSGTLDTWINIGAEPNWSLTQSGDGVDTGVITLQIRQVDFNENSASNNVTIQAAVASDVSLPATIDCTLVGQNTSVSLELSIESDGTWFDSCSNSGSYTTNASYIGELYEIQATNLVGDEVSGPDFDTWHTLDASGVDWSLFSQDGTEATFDIEIREIADTLNTTTASVTMYGTVFSTVSLPASIDTTATNATLAEAWALFEDTADWSTNDGDTGSFCDLSLPAGNRFEIYASNLVGTAPSGPAFDTWHTITTPDIQWTLSSVASDSCTFDVEIREIDNTSNSASTSVALTTVVTP